MDKYSIFLSHIHEESDLALAFKEKMEEAFIGAVEVFVSAHEDDIRIGDEWFNEIENGLESAQTVILLLTPKSVGRPWINFEAGGAWFRGKNLIPVLAKGLEVEVLPSPFNRKQAVSLSDDDSIDRLISDIADRADLQTPKSDVNLTFDKEWTSKPNSSQSDEMEDPSEPPSSADEIKDSFRHHLSSEGGLPFVDSDILFHRRMQDAFPGSRDVGAFEDPESAIDRLEILLRPPLRADDPENKTSWKHPFQWIRGTSNSPIQNFEILSQKRCLINHKDVEISRIIPVRKFEDGTRDFVYVEVEPDEPVECYEEEHDEEYIQEILKRKESRDSYTGYYVREEYGLWQGNFITRMEFDDGSAVIDGDVVSTEGEAKLRTHYLTKSNFMICSKRNVASNMDNEVEFGRVMDSIIKGESSVSELINLVENTPRPQWFDAY